MKRKATSKRGQRAGVASAERLVIRIQLRGISPPIWREINVPDSYSLLQLHRCIQLVFGWLDYHLFEFQFDARRFEAAHEEAQGERAENVVLRELKLPVGTTMLYIYDMGDYWEHDLSVQAILPDLPPSPSGRRDPCAYLVNGARAAPPEDAGGSPGYEQAIVAYNRRADKDDEDVVKWLGPGFNPDLFDRWACNHALVLATAWGVI
jgi:hypothetical protein